MRHYSPAISVDTGDYTLENGNLVEDLTVASEAILALRTRRGTCPIALNFGSRLHTIRKLDSTAPARARIYAREAVTYLVERGSMRDLVVTANRVGNRLPIRLTYRDRSGNAAKPINYEHLVIG